VKKNRVLFALEYGNPYLCGVDDIDYWESLIPTREQGLELIRLLEEDRTRDLRETMRKSVST
jgi:hypothetical protein